MLTKIPTLTTRTIKDKRRLLNRNPKTRRPKLNRQNKIKTPHLLELLSQ
jgi:hypothetical protein